MFVTSLIYQNRDGGEIRLVQPLVYRTNTGDHIRVPAGFICDGQSYPRPLWWIDHPHGDGVKAGVLHDYLYAQNGRPLPYDGKTYARKAADKLFREALVSVGVSAWRAAIRYRALRLFGWRAWRQHRKRLATLTAAIPA